MVVVYEPLYREGQTLSNLEFTPLAVVGNNRPAWREFSILVDFYRRNDHLRHVKSGIFSPKFRLKAQLDGAAFIDFARQHGAADVCIFNPYPSAAYISFNVWMHGEAFHPGLCDRAQALLDASGVNWTIADVPRHNLANLCYSSFWVGSPTFWQDYVGGVLLPIAHFLEQNPDHRAAQDVLGPTTHYTDAPFLPFIVERLFSTYLSLNPQVTVVSHPMPYERIAAYCHTDFEREIVQAIKPAVDLADKRGDFPPELKNMQRLLGRLHQKYIIEYFARHPHPHTGMTMSTARID